MSEPLSLEPPPAAIDAGAAVTFALSIVVCTYERPRLLDRLLRSLAAMSPVDGAAVEVVVVDNSEGGTARAVVAERARRFPYPLHYRTASPPNIAVARNVGVQATRHPLVAFLDDDNEVSAGWLAAVERGIRGCDRDVYFGPYRAAFEQPDHANPFVQAMFERRLDTTAEVELRAFGRSSRQPFPLGSGNSVFRRARTLVGDAPFDPAFGRSGGEDHKLLCRLQRAGRRFGWIGDAAVTEFVPVERCSLDYMARRAYVGAQGHVACLVGISPRPRLTAAHQLVRALTQAAWFAVARPWRGQPTPELRRWDRSLRWSRVRGKLAWRRLDPLYQWEATAAISPPAPPPEAFARGADRRSDADPAAATTVSVVVPTLNQADQLPRALASLAAQRSPANARLDILVVDNSIDSRAHLTVDALAERCPHPMRTVRLPRPGVASARNLGVAEAEGEWIAFLDDDEEAGPDWVAHLLATARRTNADAVFGPIDARAASDGPIETLGPYFARWFDEADGADLTRRAPFLGTCNSMFHRRCFTGGAPFATALDELGGEDSLFLQRLVRAGHVLAWAGDARVVEWVPAARLSWAYVYRRKFLSGQIRTLVQRMLEPPRWGSVVFWMGAGSVQAVGWGLLSWCARPVAPARARRWRAQAWGGLGKVLWMRRFHRGLYGTRRVS